MKKHKQIITPVFGNYFLYNHYFNNSAYASSASSASAAYASASASSSSSSYAIWKKHITYEYIYEIWSLSKEIQEMKYEK